MNRSALPWALAAVMSFAACGGSGTNASTPLNPAMSGTWLGVTTVFIPGYSPISYDSHLAVAAAGGSATISAVCFDGSGALQAVGSGNTASWHGVLACPPAAVSICPSAAVTFASATGTLSADGAALTAQGSGSMSGCGMDSTVSISFVGTRLADSVSGLLPGGTPFMARSVVALLAPPETCDHSGVTGPTTLVQIIVDGGLDQSYAGSFACDFKAQSSGFTFQVWLYASAGAFPPGTYATHDDTSGGQAAYSYAVDASCALLSSPEVVTSTITIESSTTSHLTGWLEASLLGGGRLSGRFSAPVLGSPWGTCGALGFIGGASAPGCTTSVCLP
jgi:hypothetical protein